MEKLGSLLSAPLPRRSTFTTQAQVEGGEVAQKLGAKTGKDFARVVKCFKQNPDAARRAYSFVADADARKPIALFLWRYNQILKPSV